MSSYIIDITAKILIFKENENKYLLDKILDTVGQKGTGKWSVDVSLDLEMPINVRADSVYQRYMSMLKDERIDLANAYPRDIISLKHEKNHIEELAGTL